MVCGRVGAWLGWSVGGRGGVVGRLVLGVGVEIRGDPFDAGVMGLLRKDTDHDSRTEGAAVATGRRQWIGLAVLCLATLLVSLDLFVMLLAVPAVTEALGATSSQQLWILDVYGFMVAGLMITMGNLGDRIGRRRLLLTAAAVFGVASVVAAYSISPGMLIGARAVLGIAGCRDRAVHAVADLHAVPGRAAAGDRAGHLGAAASPSAPSSARSSVACC